MKIGIRRKGSALLVVAIAMCGTSIRPAAGAGGMTARVKLQNGNEITLSGFEIRNGPLQAMIGSSATTVALDRLASIEVETTKPGASDSVKLTLTSRRDAANPISTQRAGYHHVRGTAQSGDVQYDFSTRLSMCKRIDFLESTPSLPRKREAARLACSLTTKTGKSKELKDLRVFRQDSTGTGYSRGVYGMGTEERHTIYSASPLYKIDLLTKDGVIALHLQDIDTLDLTHNTVALRGGTRMQLLEVGKTPFNGGLVISGSGGSEDASDYFAAISGFDGDHLHAVSIKDIGTVSNTASLAGKLREAPTTPPVAKHFKKLTIVDTQGQKQTLEEATMESPYGILSVGRILMSCLYPNWHVIGTQFQSVAAAPMFLSELAVNVDGFWKALPFTSIRKVTRDGKTFTLLLTTGESIPCDDVEFGPIKGKGAWGDVELEPYTVHSFEIEEH